MYPEEIRRFEKQIIDFIVRLGKEIGRTVIESHIFAYLNCHPSLTQKEIQELSRIFHKTEISTGSICNYLYKFEDDGIIRKSTSRDKRGTFIYAMKDRSMKSLMATGLEIERKNIQKWIKSIEVRMQALTEIQLEPPQIELHSLLVASLKELLEVCIFHDQFLSDNFNGKDLPAIRISGQIIEKIKQRGLVELEKELARFIQTSSLFKIAAEKYVPIYAYLLIRKRLTQEQLKKLTGLSAGAVSEGLNYLLKKNLIGLDKEKGIRKRFYVIQSIKHSFYLKQYQRFKRMEELKSEIDQINQEIINQEVELKALEGFEIISKWVEEVLQLFSIVDTGIKIYKKALNHYKE